MFVRERLKEKDEGETQSTRPSQNCYRAGDNREDERFYRQSGRVYMREKEREKDGAG